MLVFTCVLLCGPGVSLAGDGPLEFDLIGIEPGVYCGPLPLLAGVWFGVDLIEKDAKLPATLTSSSSGGDVTYEDSSDTTGLSTLRVSSGSG